MAFTDKKSLRDRGSGIAGVAIVHVGMAALLMVGLTVSGVVRTESGPLIGHTFPKPPPPPPTDPEFKPKENTSESLIVAPLPPTPLPNDFTFTVDPIKDFSESSEVRLMPLPPLDPPGTGKFLSDVAATPRNNAANWVTDADYRTIWINRDMYGSASFRLDVAANGRVDSCRITRSTGHAALDQATCALIAKRARFNPAKDGAGNTVAGSYSGSINWVLPE